MAKLCNYLHGFFAVMDIIFCNFCYESYSGYYSFGCNILFLYLSGNSIIIDGPFLSTNKSICFFAFCINCIPLLTAFCTPYSDYYLFLSLVHRGYKQIENKESTSTNGRLGLLEFRPILIPYS